MHMKNVPRKYCDNIAVIITHADHMDDSDSDDEDSRNTL